MNSDEMKGKAKAAAGKLQRKVGKLVGSRTQQVKGLEKQIAGKAQERVGKLKEALEPARKPKRRV